MAHSNSTLNDVLDASSNKTTVPHNTPTHNPADVATEMTDTIDHLVMIDHTVEQYDTNDNENNKYDQNNKICDGFVSSLELPMSINESTKCEDQVLQSNCDAVEKVDFVESENNQHDDSEYVCTDGVCELKKTESLSVAPLDPPVTSSVTKSVSSTNSLKIITPETNHQTLTQKLTSFCTNNKVFVTVSSVAVTSIMAGLTAMALHKR